jgi:hypothetical protein
VKAAACCAAICSGGGDASGTSGSRTGVVGGKTGGFTTMSVGSVQFSDAASLIGGASARVSAETSNGADPGS